MRALRSSIYRTKVAGNCSNWCQGQGDDQGLQLASMLFLPHTDGVVLKFKYNVQPWVGVLTWN